MAMTMMVEKFQRAWVGKWSDECVLHKECCIPKDVPKGHLVVYIGEDYKRFVIKISLLNHPLVKALLDLAGDEYDFSNDSKLCIPCDETIFLHVLRCAASPSHSNFSLCRLCL